MDTLKLTLPTTLSVRDKADVIVIGGGPGGIGAAVAAARHGADVLLIEHYGFLGGMATAGEVNPFMPNHFQKESLDTGIFEEWLDTMKRYGGVRGNSRVFDPQTARLAAEDLCREAGVRLLYHHRIAHVEHSDNRITGLVLHSKSGLSAATAKQYIDSTGDADLVAMAGGAFRVGNDAGDPHVQPMTLCFKLMLAEDAIPDGLEPGDALHKARPQIQEAYKRAQEAGRTSNPRENVLMFRSVEDRVIHFNSTRVIHKLSTNGQELSEAEIEGRKQLRELVDILRNEIPLFKNCKLFSIAPQIGIRESRRIVGRYTVTLDDYRRGRTHKDGIARVTYPVDIHNPNGTGTHFIELPKTAWYEIPYRSLVPEKFNNVLVACRAISADHGTHSSLRVMPPVCSIGQAAGTAAAFALRDGKDVADIDGEVIRDQLIKDGRNLVSDAPAMTCPDIDTPERKAMEFGTVERNKVLTA